MGAVQILGSVHQVVPGLTRIENISWSVSIDWCIWSEEWVKLACLGDRLLIGFKLIYLDDSKY